MAVKFPNPSAKSGKSLNKLRHKLTTGRTTVVARTEGEWQYLEKEFVYDPGIGEEIVYEWVELDPNQPDMAITAEIRHGAGAIPDSYLISQVGTDQSVLMSGGIGKPWTDYNPDPMSSVILWGDMPRRRLLLSPGLSVQEVTETHFKLIGAVGFPEYIYIEEPSYWGVGGSPPPPYDEHGVRPIPGGILDRTDNNFNLNMLNQQAIVVPNTSIMPTVFPITFEWMVAFGEGEILP